MEKDIWEIRRLVFEALGETSAVFMSQEIRGVDMRMPSKELERIGNDLIDKLTPQFPQGI